MISEAAAIFNSRAEKVKWRFAAIEKTAMRVLNLPGGIHSHTTFARYRPADFQPAINNHAQPMRKLTPPIGVIAPSQVAFVTASK